MAREALGVPVATVSEQDESEHNDVSDQDSSSHL
jgi:hypothetical protein